jgi:hypothetical protein
VRELRIVALAAAGWESRSGDWRPVSAGPVKRVTQRWSYVRLTVIVAAVVGASAATDGPGHVGPDWQQHPIWAGVVTGALLLVLGAFGVETYLRRRDTARWARLGDIGLKALGTSASEVRDAMDRLLGDPGLPRRSDGAFPPAFLGRLQEHLDTPQMRGLTVLHPRDRLERLALILEADRTARTLRDMHAGLDAIKLYHRDRLALWGSVFLASDRLVEQMGRAGELNQRLSWLQGAMSNYYEAVEATGATPEDLKADVIQRWDRLTTQTVVLQEDFMRLAGETGWRHEHVRRRLSDAGRGFLDDRDARGLMSDVAESPVGH